MVSRLIVRPPSLQFLTPAHVHERDEKEDDCHSNKDQIKHETLLLPSTLVSGQT
jgi:hypothetical protein